MSKLERLTTYRILKGFKTAKAFAAHLGISASQISEIDKKEKPTNLILALTLYTDINLEWLETGNGEMVLTSETREAALSKIYEPIRAKFDLSQPNYRMMSTEIEEEEDNPLNDTPEEREARESLTALKALPARQRENITKIVANLVKGPRDLTAQMVRDTDPNRQRPERAFDIPPSSRRIPVISWAQAGADGFFVDSHMVGTGFTDISCPHDVTDPNAYSLEISGDSMSPKYENGDYVIVSPARGVQTGNDAIVKLRDGQILAKRIKAKNGKFILSSLNPEYEDITCNSEDVVFMHRIVWVKPRG